MKVPERESKSRPTLANMFTFGDELSSVINVQGFSHRTPDVFDAVPSQKAPHLLPCHCQ